MKELWILLEVRQIGPCYLVLRRKAINFLDPATRQFIAKTAWWAMHSGYELTTRPLLSYEKPDQIEEIDNRRMS